MRRKKIIIKARKERNYSKRRDESMCKKRGIKVKEERKESEKRE